MKRYPLVVAAAVAALAGAAALLTLPALGQQGRLIDWRAQAVAAEAQLDAGVPPPEQVFIEKTSAFPGRGNVLVSVQLNDAQRSAKQADGTAEFITIGDGAMEVILRDDGRGGDATAGDGLFTGVASIDRTELAERAAEDADAINENQSSANPVFLGRTSGGTETVEPFDLASFDAGQRVPLDTAVIVLEPEERAAQPAVPGEEEPTSLGSTAGAVAPIPAAATAPRNCNPQPGPTPGDTNDFQERVLMIRNHQVVEDAARTINPCTGAGTAGGVWTFEHLVTEMANKPASGIDPSDFVEEWLETWFEPPIPEINGHTVSTRPLMERILDEWRTESGGSELDLSKAPFRLVAIAPRLDLRTTEGGGGGTYGGRSTGKLLDGGEARFVFGVVVRPAWDETQFPTITKETEPIAETPAGKCFALPFTVIFEYRVPKCDCPEVRNWARRWIDLDNHDHGEAIYRAKLARLTEQFVSADADPRRPNGSAIGQVRTNEVAMPQAAPPHTPQFVWELREFQLTQKPFSFLEETTTADTPQDRFNDTFDVDPTLTPHFMGSPLLADWIQGPVQNALVSNNDCAAPIPQVPLLFQGSLGAADNFLGANPHTESTEYFWDHRNLTHAYPFENWARHRTSIAACSGCHALETDTDFLQIDPQVPFLNPAILSGFLEGVNAVSDPADPAHFPDRHFDDLFRREVDIKKVAKMRCFRFHPVNPAHVAQSLEATGSLPDDLFQGLPVLPEELRISISADDMQRNPVSEVH
jgi:hypothetical protein